MSRVRKFKGPVKREVALEPKKRKLTKEAWWSIGIGLIMILSIAGGFVADRSAEPSISYNDFKFTVANNQYVTKVDGKKLTFVYLPTELSEIVIPDDAKSALSIAPQVLVSFKPDAEVSNGIDYARFEIGRALYEGKGKNVVPGIGGLNTQYDLPYLTCKNATSYVPMIFFEKSNSTQISYDDGCIRVRAERDEDFVKLNDRIIYFIYGVMN